MTNALLIGSLLGGFVCNSFFPQAAHVLTWLSTPALVALLIVIGWQIGTDLSWLKKLRAHARQTMIISICTVAGSLIAAALFAAVDPQLNMREGLLVASGLGFYSLSSVLLDQAGHTSLAVLTFLTNFLREFLSLLAAAFIARTFGIFAPIAATASASDSGAPVIVRASGDEAMSLCISCAFVLSLCVPLLTSLFL